jgi:hypothetical protein
MGSIMMIEQSKQSLQRLFDSYGKTNPKQGYVNAYLEWAKDFNADLVERIVTTAVRNDDRFPTIARLNELAKEERPYFSYTINMGNEDCYYCNGTGLIPELCDPNDVTPVFHIRMMACKCSTGKNIKWTPAYFKKYINPQFKNSNLIRYDWIVDQVKREKQSIERTQWKMNS